VFLSPFRPAYHFRFNSNPIAIFICVVPSFGYAITLSLTSNERAFVLFPFFVHYCRSPLLQGKLILADYRSRNRKLKSKKRKIFGGLVKSLVKRGPRQAKKDERRGRKGQRYGLGIKDILMIQI
jgi:hypothetical protein